jgi:hypothetical protein
VFPKPREIEVSAERSEAAGNGSHSAAQGPSSDDLFLARLLTGELSDHYGVALHTRRVSSPPADGAFILPGAAANPLVREYLGVRALQG